MTCLTRIDSYQQAEQQWQALLPLCASDTLFTTPQWQKIWWEQFGLGFEMLLLGFEGDSRFEGIAPLARSNGTITFAGSQDLFDYNDFLVSNEAESRFYSCLITHLEEEKWDTLRLSSLAESSPTLTHLPALAKERGYTVDVQEEDVAPGLDLPSDWEGYLQTLSKKDRHELKRKLRRLYSSEKDVQCYSVSQGDEVESSLEDFFRLMRFSREVKDHFLTGPREQFFRSVAKEMASAGVFRLFFMEIDGQRVSSAMCFDYGHSRLLYNSGYDPEYRYYSVGLLIKAFALRDAIENGKTYFDFLRGSEPYKYDLGGKDRTLYEMVVKRS